MAQSTRSVRPGPAHFNTHGTFAGFAHFLRKYMSAWPVLIACLIGPITKYLHWVPIYKDHINILAAITSLYGFLIAAALFYYRPAFIRSVRPRRQWHRRSESLVVLLPLVLLAASITAFFRYNSLVQESIRTERGGISSLVEPSQLSAEEILLRTDLTNIPDGNALMMWYLATFLAAETSLVIMALSEYLHDQKGKTS
jgi:hypothetical protein